MRQPRGDADLAEESLRLVARARHRAEHLDGHLAAVLQVFRQVDDRRAPAADLLGDAVALGEEITGKSRLLRVRGHQRKVYTPPGACRAGSGYARLSVEGPR
jgi:hypothetical protein